MSAALIDIQRLSKRYAPNLPLALDSLTLHVNQGEVYGFLGANGAGKSTAIRTLLNFLQPTSGSATICRLDTVQDSVAVKDHVGYLAGEIALYQKLTGNQLLEYLQALQPLHDRAYFKGLTKRFEADLNKPIQELSKGNRQKLGIIQALMHQPEVLILDEPTSGLDPLMQEVFYDELRQACARGAAVLMSSHNLAEAQRVCDRIGIIKHGKLIHEQSINETTELSKPVFRVRLAKAAQTEKLKKAKGLKIISESDDHTLMLQASHDLSQALKALSQFDLAEFSTAQINLEDEFLEFYGDGA